MRCRLSSLIAGLAAIALSIGPLDVSADEQDLTHGRKVYKQHCAECHGKDGRGDGEKAERLGFHPRDFTLGAFKCRSTPTGALPTAEDLRRVIEGGLPGTPMSGVGDEIDTQATSDLIAYLQTLFPAPASSNAEAIEIPQPPGPDGIDGRRTAGAAVYGLLRCWNCHGVEGRGDGPSAEALKDTWGDPIKVYDFTKRRRYKCGGRDEDLYRTLHTGLTGSPMPSYTTAFAFAADQVGDPSALESVLGPERVREIENWLSTQPTGAEIATLSESQRQDLIDRRTWQLIAYLRSLEQE